MFTKKTCENCSGKNEVASKTCSHCEATFKFRGRSLEEYVTKGKIDPYAQKKIIHGRVC